MEDILKKCTSSVLFLMISLTDIQYPCGVCGDDCEGNPSDDDKQSIGCDKCQMSYHYSCVGLEPFLTKRKSTWKCSKCNKQQKKAQQVKCHSSNETSNNFILYFI